jgi:hypothetical protein
MKKYLILFGLVAAFSAVAKPEIVIFPNVYNHGSNVTVQVWNYTDRTVNCSGPVYLDMEVGSRETAYFFDTIMAKFTSYRTIYPRTMSDRVRSVSHSISCF